MTRPESESLLPECVEPTLGRERWRLADPELGPAERERLEDHLAICDACRLDQAVAERVAAAVRAGALPAAAPGHTRRRRWLAGSVVATAAALALVVILPPRPRGPAVAPRGDAAGSILRPVEGEMIATDRPAIAWSPIDGATAYHVELQAVGDDYRWSARTTGTRLEVPADASLPRAGRYRVLVDPVPADLGRPGAVSVSFTRSSLPRAILYRGEAAPRPVQVLLLVGLLSTAWAAWPRRRPAVA